MIQSYMESELTIFLYSKFRFFILSRRILFVALITLDILFW